MNERARSESFTVRLVFDAARCDGHAICALRCPELFSLDDWGYAAVDTLPAPTQEIADRARRAARSCPNGALTAMVVPWSDLVGPMR